MMNRYAPLAVVVILASCSTEPAIVEPEPLPEPPGAVTFTYQSAVMSGSYKVVGTRDPANKLDPNGVWASGSRDAAGTLWIVGHQPVSGKGVYMFMATHIPNRTGPSAIAGNVVMFVDDPASPRNCGLGTGTVTITSLTQARVAGTFSGIGMCIPPGGLNSFEMTSGLFDVPLVDP